MWRDTVHHCHRPPPSRCLADDGRSFTSRPDSRFGKEARGFRVDLDLERGEHGAFACLGKPERDAAPAKCQDLLEPPHFGNGGVTLDTLCHGNRGKMGDQPDYRVLAGGVELGGGWIRTGEVSQREYIRLAMSAPELGNRTLYANLGRAAGQDDADTFAIIWSPGD